MDTTTAQWPQGIGVVKPVEGPRPNGTTNMLERRTRPQKDQALNCPRCNSTNTKFCYYNNYSLSQPRYFCKTCRRYWTEGGSLRNVPVGGGSRKNKRSSNTSSSSNKFPDPNPPNFPHSASQNPKILEGQDLNLAYRPSGTDHQDYVNLSKYVEVPNFVTDQTHNQNPNPSTSISTPSHHISALELLKNTAINSRGLTSFMSSIDPNTMFSTGFPLQFKPTLNFSLEGFESGYDNNIQGVHETGNARLLFPMEDMKQVPINTEFDQNNRGQGDHSTTTGYWNGMLGGGSW